MKSYSSPLPAILLAAFLVFILSLTIACGASTKLVTINLHEPEVNEIVHKTAHISSSEGWEFVINSAEIEDGFIRVLGDYTPSGSNPVSGSLNIVLKVKEGSLKGEIEQVNIQGFAAPDQALIIVNNQIAQQISTSVSEGTQQVEFESVDIQKGIVKIVLRSLP